jgi:glutamate 5-kinase
MSRLVIKVGTNILTTEDRKPDLNNLRDIAHQICDLLDTEQHTVILVTSGAITCGAEALQMTPTSIPEKQAAAAIGQSILMQEYNRFFQQRGYTCGQILLTKEGLQSDIVLNNVRNTINTLIEHKAIPIINENDSIAHDEIGIKFGDNDELSCLVAKLVQAEELILLTDIDGVFDRNPKTDAEATLIKEIRASDESMLTLAKDTPNSRSRGGMSSKLRAAKDAAEAGIDVWIANGRRRHILPDLTAGMGLGTKIWGNPKF